MDRSLTYSCYPSRSMRYAIAFGLLGVLAVIPLLPGRSDRNAAASQTDWQRVYTNEASIWFDFIDTAGTVMNVNAPGRLRGAGCFRTEWASVGAALNEDRQEIRIHSNFIVYDPPCLTADIGYYVVASVIFGEIPAGTYQVYIGNVHLGEVQLPMEPLPLAERQGFVDYREPVLYMPRERQSQ